MTRHAYETDNGPNGISWEVYDEERSEESQRTTWVASVGTREEAAAAAATVFHTLEEWYAEQELTGLERGEDDA